MLRQRLPNRRESTLLDLEHDGSRYAACIGHDQDGRPREVFISGAKPGSAMDGLLADAAIAISLALQFGMPPEALGASMSRLNTGERASVIGAIADLLAAEGTELAA